MDAVPVLLWVLVLMVGGICLLLGISSLICLACLELLAWNPGLLGGCLPVLFAAWLAACWGDWK